MNRRTFLSATFAAALAGAWRCSPDAISVTCDSINVDGEPWHVIHAIRGGVRVSALVHAKNADKQVADAMESCRACIDSECFADVTFTDGQSFDRLVYIAFDPAPAVSCFGVATVRSPIPAV